MPEFTRSFEPVSAQKIAAVERRLGVKLPPDYKQFLRTVNGGIPSPSVFDVPGWDVVCLDFLYGIGPERDSCDLEYEQEDLEGQVPPGLITVGLEPGGSCLLLRVSEPGIRRVFFFDRSGFWVGPGGQNIFPVADSFSAFLESLREDRGPAA